VFVEDNAAHRFLGRQLLFNRFDFEIFTPGNLERECIEEVCNYEEAREVFENIPDTVSFTPLFTPQHSSSSKLDVIGLLVGLIVGGVAIVIVVLIIWYVHQRRLKSARSARSPRTRPPRTNASLVVRRLEEISLQPVPVPDEHLDPPGLPSYEQAIASSGPHDAPPPPYPGSRAGSLRV
ncbi:transmembrane gamma-carboxyglutamic acid protein 4-like, partial [Arapaima gigas]